MYWKGLQDLTMWITALGKRSIYDSLGAHINTQTTINQTRYNWYQEIGCGSYCIRRERNTHAMGTWCSNSNLYHNDRSEKTATVRSHPSIFNSTLNKRVGATTIFKHCYFSVFCEIFNHNHGKSILIHCYKCIIFIHCNDACSHGRFNIVAFAINV